jgi:hypothetical protein
MGLSPMSNVHQFPATDPPTISPEDRALYTLYERWLSFVFRGYSPWRAARVVGVTDSQIIRWVDEADAHPYVIARRQQLRKTVNAKEVCTRGDLALFYVSVINDELQPTKNRIAAANAIAAMNGYVGTDDPDAGKAKQSARDYLDSLRGKESK